MNISEFERTKPVETMKSINKLINKLDKFVSIDNEANIHLAYKMLDETIVELKNIKEQLKRGD